jgi:hypothetical protein
MASNNPNELYETLTTIQEMLSSVIDTINEAAYIADSLKGDPRNIASELRAVVPAIEGFISGQGMPEFPAPLSNL